ncbi:MAG: ROK family transcriptional regulator [Ruminococcaceae bacterium]|nr:ROK family transcriptional regulator [Oscillospiraceae bacterium]
MAHATNALIMKEQNKKIILGTIFEKEASRAEIAKEIGLTKAAVSFLVDELISEGLIYESTLDDYKGVGRKPISLKIASNSYYSVGINITRKHCKIGIINMAGEVLCSDGFDSKDKEPLQIINKIIKVVEKQLSSFDLKREHFIGVGITLPGPIDYKNNKILTPPNFDKWHNFDLNILADAFNMPVYVENISNGYSICEKYFGDCIGRKNYITVLVDEGIGSGIVTNGHIYRGHKGLGNEFGHITINYQGKKCSCGNVGCLERYASIPEILSDTKYSAWREVIDNCDADLIEKEAEYLSLGLTTVINLFDLKTVVLGGDIAYKGELLAEKIAKKLKERAITKTDVEVIPSRLQDNVLIAGTIAINRFLREI